MNAKMNARRIATPAVILTRIDGRTRAGKIVRSPVVANDTDWEDMTRYAAPELPAVREVTAILDVPCDARIVVDVIRAGWCTTAKTLSYGLCRAGIAPVRVQAVILAAMRSGLIESVRGVWCLTGLVGCASRERALRSGGYSEAKLAADAAMRGES